MIDQALINMRAFAAALRCESVQYAEVVARTGIGVNGTQARDGMPTKTLRRNRFCRSAPPISAPLFMLKKCTALETGFCIPLRSCVCKIPHCDAGALLHSYLYHRTGYSTSAVISVFIAPMDEAIDAMRAQFDVALTATIEPVNFAV